MSNYCKAFDKLRAMEGGYTIDLGGETYMGISRRYHPDSRIWWFVDKEKPLKQGAMLKNKRAENVIFAFYFVEFWQELNLGDIINDKVATAILCQAVNTYDEAIEIAQKVVGVEQDGVIGPITLEAINKMDADEFLEQYRSAFLSYYHDVVTNNPSQKKFLNGWENRITAVT